MTTQRKRRQPHKRTNKRAHKNTHKRIQTNRIRRTQKTKGGLLNFFKNVKNNFVPKEIPPESSIEGEYNHLYESAVTYKDKNGMETNLTFEFITPKTTAWNAINSIRVPYFIVNGEKTNIKIKNRYINYLVKYENEWYAILRIAFAINGGIFADLTWQIYYKLANGVIDFNHITRYLGIRDNNYQENNYSTMGLFRDRDTRTILLKKEAYEPITKKSGDIFYYLRTFRQSEFGSQSIKETAVTETTDVVLDGLD